MCKRTKLETSQNHNTMNYDISESATLSQFLVYHETRNR